MYSRESKAPEVTIKASVFFPKQKHCWHNVWIFHFLYWVIYMDNYESGSEMRVSS